MGEDVNMPISFEEKNPNARLEQLGIILEKFGIKSSAIVKQITDNEDFVKEVFSFNYQLQTGKIKADKNPGGLLLKKLGLV